MITVHTIQKLSQEELAVLQSLIGKTLISVSGHGSKPVADVFNFQFENYIDLIFDDYAGLALLPTEQTLRIMAGYKETKFGDSLFSLELETGNQSGGRKTAYDHSEPLLKIALRSEFKITNIEVYGDSYVCSSENTDPDPVWNIEQYHPGQPVTEYIETENIFLLHSPKGKILITHHGIFPLLMAGFDAETMENTCQRRDEDGKVISALKHTLK